jgi:molybdate transport system substrate-binding protein
VKIRPALALAAVLVTAACSSGQPESAGADLARAAPRPLVVFAASSLTAAFTELGARFQDAHPEVEVTFNFGPSDGLAAQIQSEGTADVFASASTTWMDAVQEDPGISDRTDVASNELVVITPPDDPGGVATLEDLAGPGVQLVLAAEGVPVGEYAREALANAGILQAATANIVSNEEDNAGVVAKVAAGEADAGIVYASDVSPRVAGDLRSVEIPVEANVVATYPIGVVAGTGARESAERFVALVGGPEGRAVLRAFGFGPPPPEPGA